MLQIRPLRAADIPWLVALWVDAWRETMPIIDFDARRGWIASLLADPAHETVVAERSAASATDGAEQSAGSAIDVAERSALLGFATLQGRVLQQIVVAPLAKGSGVSAALLDAAKSRSPAGLDLEVNRDNPRAVAFYKRHGFRQVGTSINPNSSLPTLIMEWRAEAPAASVADS